MRKIRITVENRDGSDPGSLLKEISNSFPSDDLEIKIKNSSPKQYRRDEILEIKATDDAKRVLDRNEEDNLGKPRQPISKEVVEKKGLNLKKILTEQGVKVALQESYDYVSENILNWLTS